MNGMATSRRSFLGVSGAGVLGSLGGCIDTTPDKSIEPPPFDPPATDWPMAGYDAANTGFSPDATGPTTEPELEWEIQFEREDQPWFATARGRLAAAGDDELYCFDLTSGEEAWRITGAATNPVAIDTDQRQVYAGVDRNRLTAYDLEDGSERWHVPMNDTLNPPAVHEGTVYVSDHAGTILAIDATDGTERWRVTTDARPHGQLVTDGETVVTSANVEIIALAADDGKHRWSADYHHHRPPILVDETVYAAYRTAHAFDAPTGEQHWERELELVGLTTPPGFADGTLYVGETNREGFIEAVEVADGTRWTSDVGVGWLSTKLVRADETLFVGSYARGGGDITAADPADGTVRWKWRLGNGGGASRVAIVGDRLLVGTNEGKLLSLAAP